MSVREINSTMKKTSRQNSGGVGPGQSQVSLLINPASSNQHPHHQQQQQGIKLELDTESVPSFYHEISDIMRGFGDCDHPLSDTVMLIEKILQQQLKSILNDVIEISIQRKGLANPSQSDFEFLMRKHPIRINRMRKHIKDMKLLRKILKIQTGRTLQNTVGGGPGGVDDTDSHDSDDEITDLEIPDRFDEEKTRRLFRADRISQILNGVQYQRFNEARRTSFYCRHSDKMKSKFRSFLQIPHDIRLSNPCYNILAYLAHETVATLVDYAILTRLNSDNRKTDPFSRVTSSGSSYGMLHLCPEVTQGRGLEGVKPITVQEIHEALRRFNQFTKRGIGFYRNTIDNDVRKCYLAI